MISDPAKLSEWVKHLTTTTASNVKNTQKITEMEKQLEKNPYSRTKLQAPPSLETNRMERYDKLRSDILNAHREYEQYRNPE